MPVCRNLLLLTLIWAPFTFWTGLAQVEDLVKQGLQLMKESQYTEALQSFDAAKQLAPQDPRPYFFAGLTLFRTQQPRQALAEIKRAFDLDPSQPRYALTYAEFLVRAGNQSQAKTILERFRGQNGSGHLPPPQLWALSDLLFRLGEYRDALSIVDRYADSKPRDSKIAFRKAELYLALNDLDSSLTWYRRVKQENPSQVAAASYGIGEVLFRKGDLEKSRDALLTAIGKEPKNVRFANLLGTVLVALGDPAEALRYLLPVESKGERFPQLYDSIARAYRQLKLPAKVREYTRKFRAIDARRRGSRREEDRVRETLRQAQVLMKEGKLSESMERLQEVLQREPDNYFAHSYLAGIFMTLKRWGQASYHLSRARAIDPDGFETQYMVASYMYQRGKSAEALPFAQRARDLQPGFPDLRNLLGNIYFSLENFRQAVKEYRAALKLDPGRQEFRLNLEAAKHRLQPQ